MEEVIVEKYSFRHKICDCGLDLSDKSSIITSLYRAVRPMGACPGCGKQMLLNAPFVASKVVVDYELSREPSILEEIVEVKQTKAVKSKSQSKE